MTEGRRAKLQLTVLRVLRKATRLARGRGMQRGTWVLSSAFPETNRAVVQLPSGRLYVYLDDGYWIRLLFSDYEYEPELYPLLEHLLKTEDVYFFDCGANIGYWTTVANHMLPGGRIVAVEANDALFVRLVENRELNHYDFVCQQVAIWSSSGEYLPFQTNHKAHADGTLLTTTARHSDTKEVATLSLADLVQQHAPEHSPVIIKLDIEGAEIAALHGSRDFILEKRPLLIYEDHGNDSKHSTTRYIMDQLGLEVFWPAESGVLHKIEYLSQLDSIKIRKYRGYNFVATAKYSQFLPHLLLMPWAPQRPF